MQHLDEGTIHAWLDGALPAAEGEAVERHAAGCAQCGALVAEARGLLAASSRIVHALDADAPVAVAGHTAPGAAPPPAFAARAAALSADSARPARRRWARPGFVGAAAAAVLALAVFRVSRVSTVQDDTASADTPAVFTAARSGVSPAAPAPAPAAAPTVTTAPPEAARAASAGVASAEVASAEVAAEPPPSRAAPPAAPPRAGQSRSAKVAPAAGRESAVADAAAGRAGVEIVAAAPADRAPAPSTVSALQGRAPGATISTRGRAVLRGRVTGGAGEPVAGAAVSVATDGRTVGAVTDTAGRYTIAGLDPGSYTVRARRIGYAAVDETVEVVPGEGAAADFTLAPSATQLDAVVATGVGAASGPAIAAARRAVPVTAAGLAGCYTLRVGRWDPPRGVAVERRALPTRITLDTVVAAAGPEFAAQAAGDARTATLVGGTFAGAAWTTDGRAVYLWLDSPEGAPSSSLRLTMWRQPAGELRGVVEAADPPAEGSDAILGEATARRGCAAR